MNCVCFEPCGHGGGRTSRWMPERNPVPLELPPEAMRFRHAPKDACLCRRCGFVWIPAYLSRDETRCPSPVCPDPPRWNARQKRTRRYAAPKPWCLPPGPQRRMPQIDRRCVLPEGTNLSVDPILSA